MDRVRKATEHCDALQGFIATHSCSGGTGGGLTAYIFRVLASDYEKFSVVQLPVYPAPQHSNAIVEPYNTVLHLDQAVDAVKLSTMMDNEAIGEVCRRDLMHRQPTFHTMNQVIALLTSSFISPIRYSGCLTAGLQEMETNLVPFPRIHFPVLRHAPFMHCSHSEHRMSNIDQLVQQVFSNTGQTVKCDLNRGKFMACVLSFRGLVGPRLVNSALSRIKVTPHYEYVDWCPTGLKVNLVAQPPVFVAQDAHISPTDCSVTMLANSTAISSVWASVGAKFDMMFSRRCFVHWFLNEGLEEAELKEARETLASIEQDYREISLISDRNFNFKPTRPNLASIHRRGDLTPCDIFKFPNAKGLMRGIGYESPIAAVEDFTELVEGWLALEWFSCSTKQFERLELCMNAGGEYVEKIKYSFFCNE
ncbi:unnamed protein product [Echinostoma caproni]|uniref:Tubulin_C domain-containing protein n=1 Tax=Echinostoma caproni TaxID=27848 RepID=A0A183A7U7_9TREM|nr:unnamed protein product [Echinostoma caproni]